MQTVAQLSTDALALIPQDANCTAECETLIRDAGEGRDTVEASAGALCDAIRDAAEALYSEYLNYRDDEMLWGQIHSRICREASDELRIVAVHAEHIWQREGIMRNLRESSWATPAGQVVAAQIAVDDARTDRADDLAIERRAA